jgi:hypothetical protein
MAESKWTTQKIQKSWRDRLQAVADRDNRTRARELEFLIESAEKWNPAPTPERVKTNG